MQFSAYFVQVWKLNSKNYLFMEVDRIIIYFLYFFGV